MLHCDLDSEVNSGAPSEPVQLSIYPLINPSTPTEWHFGSDEKNETTDTGGVWEGEGSLEKSHCSFKCGVAPCFAFFGTMCVHCSIMLWLQHERTAQDKFLTLWDNKVNLDCKEPVEEVWSIWLGCFLHLSLLRFSGSWTGRRPRTCCRDHVLYPIWPGNVIRSSKRIWSDAGGKVNTLLWLREKNNLWMEKTVKGLNYTEGWMNSLSFLKGMAKESTYITPAFIIF